MFFMVQGYKVITSMTCIFMMPLISSDVCRQTTNKYTQECVHRLCIYALPSGINQLLFN